MISDFLSFFLNKIYSPINSIRSTGDDISNSLHNLSSVSESLDNIVTSIESENTLSLIKDSFKNIKQLTSDLDPISKKASQLIDNCIIFVKSLDRFFDLIFKLIIYIQYIQNLKSNIRDFFNRNFIILTNVANIYFNTLFIYYKYIKVTSIYFFTKIINYIFKIIEIILKK